MLGSIKRHISLRNSTKMLLSINYGNFTFDSSNGYPTPKVTIDKKNNRTSSEQYLSSTQTVSLEGIIYLYKLGSHYSPSTVSVSSSSGLLQKAIDLKNILLSQKEPSLCTIKAGDQPFVSGSGYISSINFDTNQDRAVNKIDYTIEIELFDSISSGLLNSKPLNLRSVQESVDIETNWDESYMESGVIYPTYKISRKLSASANKMNRVAGSQVSSLSEAAEWINSRQSYFTGLVPDTGSLYDYNRSIDIDEGRGSINFSDDFIYKSGQPWIDTYTVSTSMNEDLSKEIKINGTIKGLHKIHNLNYVTGSISTSGRGAGILSPLLSGGINSGNMKYTNALSGYLSLTGMMFYRASGYNSPDKQPISDLPPGIKINSFLNKIPISITEGFNPANGTIEYTYVFNNRSSGSIISGALSEVVNVTDNGPLPRISNIPVLGRRLGPVVYFYISSSGMGERTATYEGVFKPPTGFRKFKVDNNILNSISAYISGFAPKTPYTGLVTSDTNSINMNENRIRRSVTWQYTKCADG